MFNLFKKKQPSTTEAVFGQTDFLGDDMTWRLDDMPGGIFAIGGTGSGKTNRLFLPLMIGLTNMRQYQEENLQWGGVFIDPKLSFASRLISLFEYMDLGWNVAVISETQAVPINPLRSGLSGQKIAEMLVKSLFAGKTMTTSSGAAYYESRAQALLGHLITVAIYSNEPCLRKVAQMVDALTLGHALASDHPKAAEALQRIHIFSASDEEEKKKTLDSVQNYLEPYRIDPWKKIFFEPGPFTLDVVRDEGRFLIAAFSPNKVNNLSSGLFLLKSLWYTAIMERMSSDFTGNKERLCLFMIDEFASVASSNNDSEFLAMRREARACPIFAIQQITQLETALPTEWKTVLGLLTTHIYLRQSDIDTALYAEKKCGYVEISVDAVTTTPGFSNLLSNESSRTTTRQLQARIPADYFTSLPDGDAVIVNDKRTIAWFPAAGMNREQEVALRKLKSADRPGLVHPRDFRS
jgi:hypothetical protein